MTRIALALAVAALSTTAQATNFEAMLRECKFLRQKERALCELEVKTAHNFHRWGDKPQYARTMARISAQFPQVWERQ